MEFNDTPLFQIPQTPVYYIACPTLTDYYVCRQHPPLLQISVYVHRMTLTAVCRLHDTFRTYWFSAGTPNVPLPLTAEYVQSILHSLGMNNAYPTPTDRNVYQSFADSQWMLCMYTACPSSTDYYVCTSHDGACVYTPHVLRPQTAVCRTCITRVHSPPCIFIVCTSPTNWSCVVTLHVLLPLTPIVDALTFPQAAVYEEFMPKFRWLLLCRYTACPTPSCNKKVVDMGSGSYRCEKCNKEFYEVGHGSQLT